MTASTYFGSVFEYVQEKIESTYGMMKLFLIPFISYYQSWQGISQQTNQAIMGVGLQVMTTMIS